MTIVITESAADDLAEGYLFYEEQQAGLGTYFESFLLAEIRSLLLYAGVHEVHFGKYFRKITDRFPYAIYYTVDEDMIRTQAVVDTRRNPKWIGKRLRTSI